MDLSPVDLVLVVILCVLVVTLLVQAQAIGALRKRLTRLERGAGPQIAPGTTGLSPQAEAEVWRLVRADKKVQAVKVVRQETGLPLQQALDLVNRF